MTGFTRITVAGRTRRADLVVPRAEPLGVVLPTILDLLGEPTGTVTHPAVLVRPDGEQLDLARTSEELDLLDGTSLTLVRLDAAPPPPAVIDLTDAATDAHARRSDRWDERSRLALAGVAAAIATATAGLVAPFASPTVALVVLAGGTVVVTAAALVLGLLRMRSAAVLVAAAAAGCALPAGVVAGVVAAQVSGDVDPVASAVAGAGVGLALLGTVLAVAIGGGLRRVGAGAAGVMAILLSLLVLALLVAGVGTSAAVGVVGVVAVFATGVLPWVALGSAGLTGLDQRVAEGERLDRATARDRIDDAYSVLTWSTAITSAFATIATVALVLGAPVWSPLLALAIALAGALRSRAFPLRISSAVLWSPLVLGGATAVLALLGGPVGAWGVAVCLLAAAGIAVLALVSPRENTRARLRGLGNALEMLAVVALLPLLFGVFGVYAELLGMFGGGS
ncbi:MULTISPECIES: EsaB/YukD family protein [Microbacterium]|uniref:EsaB/YukD family protein n=1 Tax=Microbacterium TaxID=33882 RepID=UPI000C6B8F28|nr:MULTISPECIES: EsaB/YukD family protein [Microbacterium]MAY50350.1 hypothetical protein [Microbacterium sp.]|tara:strand:- start:785 stop:2140 length:1356 start_codon:yes stop_codon:yes gene_type:complete